MVIFQINVSYFTNDTAGFNVSLLHMKYSSKGICHLHLILVDFCLTQLKSCFYNLFKVTFSIFEKKKEEDIAAFTYGCLFITNSYV